MFKDALIHAFSHVCFIMYSKSKTSDWTLNYLNNVSAVGLLQVLTKRYDDVMMS